MLFSSFEVALNSRTRQAADELFSDYVKLFRTHMEASGFTVQASQVIAIAQYGSTNIMMACDFAEEQRTSSIVVRSESPALDDEYAVSVSRIPVLNAGEITPKSPIEKAQQRLATLKQEYTSDAHLRFIVHPRNSAPIERDTFQSVLEPLLPE